MQQWEAHVFSKQRSYLEDYFKSLIFFFPLKQQRLLSNLRTVVGSSATFAMAAHLVRSLPGLYLRYWCVFNNWCMESKLRTFSTITIQMRVIKFQHLVALPVASERPPTKANLCRQPEFFRWKIKWERKKGWGSLMLGIETNIRKLGKKKKDVQVFCWV